MITASQFVSSAPDWPIPSTSALGLEITIPDLDGIPDPAALALVNTALEVRAEVDRHALAYLDHHLASLGPYHLAGVHVLKEPDRHGASVLLIYHTLVDRYLWIEVALAGQPTDLLTPRYALISYW